MHPQHAQALAARRVGETVTVDGTPLCVRSVAHDDRDRLSRLFARLSPQSIRLRYFSPIRQLPDAQLTRFIDVDHKCHELLVALSGDEIIAEARYDGVCGTGEAEIAMTVEDTWQHRGIGVRLARRLMVLAAERGFNRFVASILPENKAALGLVRELAPSVSVRWDSGTYVATIPLASAS